jgi:hypothetical protein
MIERMRAQNLGRLGKLVKTWSTGENHLGDGKDYPIPTTLDELKDQLAMAETGATIPARITKMVVVPQDMETLVLRLPPGELIKDSEEILSQGDNQYVLPTFYKDIVFAANGEAQIKKEVAIDFHDHRIGDYTIANCM